MLVCVRKPITSSRQDDESSQGGKARTPHSTTKAGCQGKTLPSSQGRSVSLETGQAETSARRDAELRSFIANDDHQAPPSQDLCVPAMYLASVFSGFSPFWSFAKSVTYARSKLPRGSTPTPGTILSILFSIT